MKIELTDYTHDGVNKIARLTRATRKTEIEPPMEWSRFGDDNSDTNANYLTQEAKNRKFVKNLIKIKHEGVLEHINFTFHVSEISRVLTHQLVRHRIGFSFLQMSNRHAKPACRDFIEPPKLSREEHVLYNIAVSTGYDYYLRLINKGVKKEDARLVLPPAFFTHITFTCNARSLYNFLDLRLAKDAQWEIRDMACGLFDIVYHLYPTIFEGLKNKREKVKNYE